jgi:ATP-dependent DNA helicase DinG
LISFTEDKGLDVEQVLGAEGLVSQSYSGFEVRTEQLKMARSVQEALNGNYHLAVEAGTGVGKSFAYLVGAIDQVHRNNVKVLLSTYTITLQEQLINKDIPFLSEIMGKPFTACLAKGRNNYLCRRRLDYALRRQKGLFDEVGSELMRISEWAQSSEDGSLSDLPRMPSSNVWDAVQSEHGNCRGRKCKHFRKCFYWHARRELKAADIIVANHALLFSDLVLKEHSPGILPEYDFAVIDEAHNIEHVAEEHFGINISNFTFSYLLNRLYNSRTRKGLLAYRDDTQQARKLIKECQKSVKVFFAQIEAWYEHSKEDTSGRCYGGFVDDNITNPLKVLRLELSKCSKQTDDEDERFEFTRYIDRCRDLEAELKDFLTQPQKTNVYWVEVGTGRRKRIALRSAPLNVGPDVKRVLFDGFSSIVLTSATLSCAGAEEKEGFDFFASRIGLEEFEAVKLGSPFDYQRQVTLYIEADLPGPNHKDFPGAASEAIKKYLLKTDGRAFVLFTSYKMLNDTAGILENWMAENDMTLLAQGSGTDRAQLLSHFKSDERSVLFGTDSFWQGVDVPGESLSNVIIVRLPFAVPNHPLIQGRIEQLQSEGHNPFFTYQLPTAIIKFKQGFGRLIRNKTDSGIVVVLDSRIVHKNYGRSFIEAIPQCRIEIVSERM